MLKVWLPLDGDLRNLGASDIEVTNNGATVDNAGKIGKCYYFNGSTYLKESNYDWSNFNISQFSLCCWYKEPSPVASGNSQIICIGTSSGWNNIRIGLLRRNSNGYPMFSISNGSSAIQYGFTASKFTLDNWNHIAVTYNNGELKMYLNGVIDKTSTTTITPVLNNSQHLGIGSASNGAEKLTGYLNDIRIYDHCLSAAEVKEIAQGLVLHYKLDSMRIKTGTNLVTGVTKGGHTTVLTDGRIGVQTTGENADTYFTINLSESITNGTKYFLSCDASGISEGAYWGFPLGQQGNSTLLFKIYNGHNEYSFTANDISWGSNRLFMDDVNRADWANKATFWNFELYKTPALEVEDSSGYGHNGEIISELHISNDTARYNNSTLFDGVDDCIIVPYNAVCPENIFTINLWFKKDALGSKNYETLFGGPSGFEMDTRAGSATSLSLYMASTRSSNRATGITMNEWHMITMTRDGTTEKYYVDGEFKSEIEAKSMPNGVYRIGAWASNTGQNYYGLISDFRIYCTPLLDTDIKLLYNISMRVNNLGGIHTFKFEEKGGRELLAGVPITTSYSNHTNVYTNYTNGEIKLTGSSSVSTPYIPISPSGKTYYYDLDVSVDANNQVYIGFERYDANKTARSNNATVYVMSPKPSTALTHQRYRGTVNLSTDGVNPCAFITLRILNDWSGAASRSMTVHKISLREVTTIQSPKLYKTGIFTVDKLNEHLKSSLYKNGFVEATEFIEI